MNNRLHRSTTNKYLGGVCGGIAETYGWDPTVVRLLFLALILLPGSQLILYPLAWLIIPKG